MSDTDTAVEIEESPPDPNFFYLPESFYEARPEFARIRQAAQSRLIAPDAAMHAALTRISALADHRIVLEGVVCRYGSLNLATVFVGPSGAGKGSVLDLARELLPAVGMERFREIPVGSGEGIVNAFFESKTIGTGQDKRTVPIRKLDSALIRIDEGQMLKALAQRSGQTTMEVLRSAWSGEQLGNTYADRERRDKILPPFSYRCAVAMGLQPEHGDALLNKEEIAGGTTQRFLFAPWTDPYAPDLADSPEWPHGFAWQCPTWKPEEEQQVMGLAGCYVMPVDAEIKAQIRETRLLLLRGSHKREDPLDSHVDLLNLKVAGLLALFQGRLNVDPEDWRLANMVTRRSREIRKYLRHFQLSVAAEADDRAIERSVKREVAIRDIPYHVERVAAWMARKLDDGPMTRSALYKAAAGRDRRYFDGALARAVETGTVIDDDGKLRAA
jgi:hypothetical protein